MFAEGIDNYSNVSFETSDVIFRRATGHPSPSLSFASGRISEIISLSRTIDSGIPSIDSVGGRSEVNGRFLRLVAQLVTYG